MRLFNDGWEFCRQKIGIGWQEMREKQDAFYPVGIPHDWLIYHPKDLYGDAVGWYRKKFSWKKKEDELVFLRFDGIYMDSRIYINGEQAGEWKYGYSTFEVDATPYLKDGENEVEVSVTYQSPNSRWYTGAGIYRNVWLKSVPKEHIVSDGVYFSAVQKEAGLWQIWIDTQLAASSEGLQLCYALKRREEECFTKLSGEETAVCEADGTQKRTFETVVYDPAVWDVDAPHCYDLQVTLKKQGNILQTETQTVGFRTMEFSPQEGLRLNGRHLKLQGVCEHHDLGCLGAAFHKKAMKRKFLILKEMGVNAVRLAHNMPAPEVMELADEMGILIVTEAFDMWEASKNDYDYARFFKEWHAKDIASWVRRDRNHPSLLLWSIGNEIYDTHAGQRGQEWCGILMKEVKTHDPRGNAAITIASNYMPWENAQKCADMVKIAGYNYGEKYYARHHKEHPDWIIYGSETGSVVQSRGIYHFPYKQSVLTDEDGQCSSLGNSTTSWGAASAEACLKAEIDHPYSCGQFVWTGFDFIGEPTPYHSRNSYFGQVDTAGFCKDSYYMYQAGWKSVETDPMVHILPYWDFNEGQLIDVRVCSNAPLVELFFNGNSQGIRRLDQKHGTAFAGLWRLPYAPGELRAVARSEQGEAVAEETRHSFGDAARICLHAEQKELRADGEDLLFVEISMKDRDGYPVENDNSYVRIEVSGAGVLIGTDNGDSTDTDAYQSPVRRLFGGRLLAVCKAGAESGRLTMRVYADGIPDETLEVPVKEAPIREGISVLAHLKSKKGRQGKNSISDEKTLQAQVRKISMSSSSGLYLNPEHPSTVVTAELFPHHAKDRQLFWKITDDAGIEVKYAAIETEADGLHAKVTAKSDGSFHVRCMSKSGTQSIRLISALELTAEGFGKADTNPYEFVSAGLYDYSKGDVGNGNEHGVATARDGESQIGFHNLDFGAYGSDKVTIPIFALTDDPYEMQIYEGMPQEGGESLGTFTYQKKSVWNVYQEETFRLPKRLKGVTGICFAFTKKVHVKGFCFQKYERAWQALPAGECDRVYGDSFAREGTGIVGIGNNVTLTFEGMDFGGAGTSAVTIWGSTPNPKNTIVMKFSNGAGEEERLADFAGGTDAQTFEIEPVCGAWDVSFVFLPGSNFDFYQVQFQKNRKETE